MPTPNEKPRPDLNSKIFPLQFRTLFYFCSFDLDGGHVSSTGSTLPLSLFCCRSVSSVLDRLLISRALLLCTHLHLVTQESQLCSCLRKCKWNANRYYNDVHCTYCKHRTKQRISGIKSPLHSCWDKITVKNRRGGFLDARGGGGPEPLEPSPGYAPVNKDLFFFRFTDFLRSSIYFSSIVISINVYHVGCGDGRQFFNSVVQNMYVSTPGFLTEPCYHFFSHYYEPLPFFFSRPKQLY